jgi:hypothetical protein
MSSSSASSLPAASGAGASTASAPLPLVFVLGDSISMHYGPYLEARLAGRMRYARKTGNEAALGDLDAPQVRDANGGDSRMVFDFLRAVCADPAFRPDILLLNCGLHDIKTDPATGARQVALADYERNLRAAVALVPAAGIRLVWARTTPVDDATHNRPGRMDFHRHAADVAVYNAAADAIMAQAGVLVVDLYAFTAALGAPEAIFADHVHFVEPVRERQAEFLVDLLVRSAGFSRSTPTL